MICRCSNTATARYLGLRVWRTPSPTDLEMLGASEARPKQQHPSQRAYWPNEYSSGVGEAKAGRTAAHCTLCITSAPYIPQDPTIKVNQRRSRSKDLSLLGCANDIFPRLPSPHKSASTRIIANAVSVDKSHAHVSKARCLFAWTTWRSSAMQIHPDS